MSDSLYPRDWFGLPQRATEDRSVIDDGDDEVAPGGGVAPSDALTAGQLAGQPREYPASLLPRLHRSDDGLMGDVD